MICAWIDTSSAETGSSQTTKSGRARAPGRCRCAGAGRRRTRAGSGGKCAAAGPRARAARDHPVARAPARWRGRGRERLGRRSRRPCCAGSATRRDPGRRSACAGEGAAGSRPSAVDVDAVERTARRSARAAAGWRGRAWTCRSRIRRSGQASRRGRPSRSTPSTARHRGAGCRPSSRRRPRLTAKCLASPRDLEEGQPASCRGGAHAGDAAR